MAGAALACSAANADRMIIHLFVPGLPVNTFHMFCTGTEGMIASLLATLSQELHRKPCWRPQSHMYSGAQMHVMQLLFQSSQMLGFSPLRWSTALVMSHCSEEAWLACRAHHQQSSRQPHQQAPQHRPQQPTSTWRVGTAMVMTPPYVHSFRPGLLVQWWGSGTP